MTENPQVLVLSNVSRDDEGWYTCIAGNKRGMSHASTYLHVIDSKQSCSLISESWQDWNTYGLAFCSTQSTSLLCGN
jgi:hypothetical protein